MFRENLQYGLRVLGLAICLTMAPMGAPLRANDAGSCIEPGQIPAAGQAVPDFVTRPLFDELIGWIALRTDYDLTRAYREPPLVSFCAIGEIVDYEGGKLLVEKGLRAAFDYPDRHIYLVRPWSVDNLFDRSVLLHEMIHDIQFSNRKWPCPSAPELEAYLLQDRWLREHGVVYPFNWLVIFDLSNCQERQNAN